MGAGLAVLCHSLPFPQEDAENDIEPRHGVQSNLNNQNHRRPNNQNHRNPDRPRAPAPNPGPGCRIEYETIYEIIEDETFDQKCRTNPRKEGLGGKSSYLQMVRCLSMCSYH